MKTPEYIFIHHTAVSYELNPDQAEATNNFHKKWGLKSSLGYYAGYNAEISRDGKLTVFRQDGEVTAAQYQQNMNDGRALSIALDGNFDVQVPTAAQREALVAWLQSKMDKYDIPPERVRGHRAVAVKTCPGKNITDPVYDYFMKDGKRILADWEQEAIDKAVAKGVAMQWDDPDQVVMTATAEYMLFNAGIVDGHQGSISKVRLAKIFEKLGLLDGGG